MMSLSTPRATDEIPSEVVLPTASLTFLTGSWVSMNAALRFFTLAPLSWSHWDYAVNALLVVSAFALAMVSLLVVDRRLKAVGVLET